MAGLTHTQHPLVATAWELAQTWYTPTAPWALGHAAATVDTLNRHVTDADPQLIAAAIVSGSPSLAPKTVALYDTLTAHLELPVVQLVGAAENQNSALNILKDPKAAGLYIRLIAQACPEAAWINAADKIVTLNVLQQTMKYQPDALHPYNSVITILRSHIEVFHVSAAAYLPASMNAELKQLLDFFDRRCCAS